MRLIWEESHRADKRARLIADRHYSRQKIGTQQFVPPGRCLVLYAKTETGQAYWVTSWPFAEYVKHRWPGAWVCSAFRNEGAAPAIGMIREAISCTVNRYGPAPDLGMITFVDPTKVQPTKVHGKDVYGWVFIKAGFRPDGMTKGGLHALRLWPEDMPEPAAPFSIERSLF